MQRNLVLIGILIFMSCKGGYKTTRQDSIPRVGELGKDSLSKIAASITTSEAKKQGIKPYKLIDNWMVLDSGEYEAGPMGGSYLIVEKNKRFVDTIEKGYGIIKVTTNSYLYQKLTRSNDEGLPVSSSTEHFLPLTYVDYILSQEHKNVSLSNTVKDFHFYFSSPYPINEKIYFWQLKEVGNDGNYKIYAAEYNPTKNTSNASYLKTDYIETDDAGYFPNPYAIKDTIYFALNDSLIWKFSPSFKPYK